MRVLLVFLLVTVSAFADTFPGNPSTDNGAPPPSAWNLYYQGTYEGAWGACDWWIGEVNPTGNGSIYVQAFDGGTSGKCFTHNDGYQCPPDHGWNNKTFRCENVCEVRMGISAGPFTYFPDSLPQCASGCKIQKDSSGGSVCYEDTSCTSEFIYTGALCTSDTDDGGDGAGDGGDGGDGTGDGGGGGGGTGGDDGEGEGTGTGTASGSCDVAPTCDGGDSQLCAILIQEWHSMCGGEYGDTGKDFYTGDDVEPTDKMETVLTNFKTRLSAAPVVTTVTDKFSFVGGGTCPTWDVSVPVLGAGLDFTIDQFCSPSIPWGVIAGVVIFLASIAGFYIAFR